MFSKEKEKDTITEYLKNLGDEEREVENIFKNNKLESWSAGLQKSLTQYVASNYDEERLKLEQQAIKEYKMNKDNNITAMNKEIYKLDIEYEESLNKEINEEEYNIKNIGWVNGIGSFFTLDDDNYAIGDIKVKIIDNVGNESNNAINNSDLIIESTQPSDPIVSFPAKINNTFPINVSFIESNIGNK